MIELVVRPDIQDRINSGELVHFMNYTLDEPLHVVRVNPDGTENRVDSDQYHTAMGLLRAVHAAYGSRNVRVGDACDDETGRVVPQRYVHGIYVKSRIIPTQQW